MPYHFELHPPNAASFVYTGPDGTFSLLEVPQNTSYTLVIQAGKWRRQFPVDVAADAVSGLTLQMPADHTQGDIPMIAIATGSADSLECVLREMGIADSEFTDDNGGTNPNGRIHLYQGNGAVLLPSPVVPPTENALINNASTLSQYDMVMFPCLGGAVKQTTAAMSNLVSYANLGGRVFATHYSDVWLDSAAPYNSQFLPSVANWNADLAGNYQLPDGIATVNTGFTDGATFAAWLPYAGALYNNTPGQIAISTLRHDFTTVNPPTQPWLTLNNAVGNPQMQFTFNTPVGAAADKQCGRVLYTEYHVFNASGASGTVFPKECPASHSMIGQEKMLEFALFDLSSFVTPVVVPSLTISFSPSPLTVKQGDSADQVTVNLTNTSTNAPIYSSAVLTFKLPAGLAAAALTDSTGGWTCTVGTLTCMRTNSIAPGDSDPVTLTVSVPPYGGGSGTSGLIVATVSSPNFSNDVTASDTVIFQQPPAITWATPAPVTYGTALSGTQLNASSQVAGTFSYSPAAGTVLSIGQHTLTATISPTDTVNYTTSTANVTLTVIPATPVVKLSVNTNPQFLTYAVTFTATVSSTASTPTGTVAFYDGATQMGPGTVTAGVATYTSSSLTTGIHSISAVYSGDTNYQTASSDTLAETIEDFTLALSGGSGAGSVTVSPGAVAAYPLVLTPVGGSRMPAAISLSVTGLSFGATAAFSPASVAIGSAAANVTLKVTLPGQAAAKPLDGPFRKGSLPVALGLILLPFAARLRKAARRWRKLVVLALASAALALGLNGCGGGVTLSPETYTLTITAASGSLSHSMTVKMIVQSASH